VNDAVARRDVRCEKFREKILLRVPLALLDDRCAVLALSSRRVPVEHLDRFGTHQVAARDRTRNGVKTDVGDPSLWKRIVPVVDRRKQGPFVQSQLSAVGFVDALAKLNQFWVLANDVN